MTDVGMEALDLLTVSEVAQRLRCSPKNVTPPGRGGAAAAKVKMGSLVQDQAPEVGAMAYKNRLIAEAEAEAS